ncbi:hypothetical protein [Wenzhouxiangella marina]|uniref:Uncharacterized protein n=1 Tax=Wenzhouxiangella marina TaxID=1579979 RepID=A0A0K0XZW5_9GAMM|nr:hypothetical protein [Wenzhouxiangella marina]AKS43223.1 hypothetical protein WM2015_2866 [Wenzhouxiangella marina]MBB6087090.1 hypothetical protein [Wenzhouxiangella marina]
MPQHGPRTWITLTAWHEAGHALAAMREGRCVVGASVSFERPGFGTTRMVTQDRPNHFNPMASPGNARASWEDSLARYLSELRILLAGPLAEAKAVGKPLRSMGGTSDLNRCDRLAERLQVLREFVEAQGVACGPDIPARFNHERDRVRRWLGRREIWNTIERIAAQLMDTQRVSAQDVFGHYLAARGERQHSLPLTWQVGSRAWDGMP